MHALSHGQCAVARKLIAKGVKCDELAPPQEPGGPPRTMLQLAVQAIVLRPNEKAEQREEALDTLSDLVRAGAATALPSLDGRQYTSDEMYTLLRDPSHVLGLALGNAEEQIDAEQVDFRYRCVRVMLIAGFLESPGAALAAFVALLFTMRAHADRVHLSDNELATSLRDEAMEVCAHTFLPLSPPRSLCFSLSLLLALSLCSLSASDAMYPVVLHAHPCASSLAGPRVRLRGQVGTTVGLFVKTLPDAERERLLRSTPGENFLRFAAESNCRKICFAPAISHHINLRWSGELLSALETGEGAYRWGGRLR